MGGGGGNYRLNDTIEGLKRPRRPALPRPGHGSSPHVLAILEGQRADVRSRTDRDNRDSSHYRSIVVVVIVAAPWKGLMV